MNNKKPWTFIFIGNPSRGDDAIGPVLFQQMERWLNQQYASQTKKPNNLLNDIQLIDCFQLEPELCFDIESSTALMIIDACTIDAPYPWIETLVDSNQEACVWTHAMSPSSLLVLFRKIYKSPPPTTYLLHIPGEKFDLGAPLSQSVEKHQPGCLSFLQQCCLATSLQELQVIALNNTIKASQTKQSQKNA